MNCKKARYCLSLDVDGRLQACDAPDLRKHLEGCRECREYEATIRGLGRVLEQMPKSTPLAGGWQRLQARMEEPVARRTAFPRILAPAGAAIILFAVIAYVGIPRSTDNVQPPVVVTDTIRTQAVARIPDEGSKPSVKETNKASDPDKAVDKPKPVKKEKPAPVSNEKIRYRPAKRTERYVKAQPQPVKHRRILIREEPRTEVMASAEPVGQGLSNDMDSLIGQGFSTLVEAGAANTDRGGANL